MSGPRTRFVSASAVAGAYDADARRAWLLLLAKARDVAAQAAAGRIDRNDGAAFAGLLVRLNRAFPLGYASATAASAVFLQLARAFLECGWPASIAGFVAAGAECLEAMLIEDGHRHAAIARRQAGEAD